MIQPEQSSTVHTHQHGGRKGSGASSAGEQEESSGLEHGKFSLWLRSIVAHYPAKGKHLVGLALAVNGDRELRSGRGLSLQRDLANDSAKVTEQ